MRWLLRIGQLSAIGLLLVACSAVSNDTSTTEPVVAVTVDVPSDWITYSNEVSGFSISYPNDWEVIVGSEAALDALFDDLGIVSEEIVALQVGMGQLSGGFNPSFSITVRSIPDNVPVDELIEDALRKIKSFMPSFVVTEQVKTIIGGRESILLFGSYEMSDLFSDSDDRFSMTMNFTVDGLTAWLVNCGRIEADTSTTAPDLEECDTIVRTFELSSN